MKRLLYFYAIVFVVSIAMGCASSEPAASTDTSTPSTKSSTTGTAELVKCPGCQTEVAAADLQDHDGQKLCKKCIDAHGH